MFGRSLLVGMLTLLCTPFIQDVANAQSPDSTSRLADALTNSVGMVLRLIPAGEFTMGSPPSEIDREDDETAHRVQIGTSYYLGTTEVTQGQWTAVMGTSHWRGKEHVREGANYPAVYISWDDAVAFCEKLSAKEGRGYRLPTEAEWEYACRAGATTAFCFGDDASKLSEYAWFDIELDENGFAREVGKKKANKWGLYDMHGNVEEWCSDPSEVDPRGPSPVFRGGNWAWASWDCRCASRKGCWHESRTYDMGFRVALSPSNVSAEQDKAE